MVCLGGCRQRALLCPWVFHSQKEEQTVPRHPSTSICISNCRHRWNNVFILHACVCVCLCCCSFTCFQRPWTEGKGALDCSLHPITYCGSSIIPQLNYSMCYWGFYDTGNPNTLNSFRSIFVLFHFLFHLFLDVFLASTCIRIGKRVIEVGHEWIFAQKQAWTFLWVWVILNKQLFVVYAEVSGANQSGLCPSVCLEQCSD